MEINDILLVKKVQAGDNNAFGKLVLKYQKQVYEKAYSFTHNVEDANDLVQDIFIKTFKAIDTFQGDSAFYTWLYQIAQNAGIDYIRKKKRRSLITFEDTKLIDLFCKKTQVEPIERLENKEINSQIKKAINKLSIRQKQVFVLRHYEGLTLKEIADKLGLKIGSIKAHHFHAARKLRKYLSNYIEE